MNWLDINYIFLFINQFLSEFQGESTWAIIYVLMFDYWLWVVFLYIFIKYLFWPEFKLAQGNKWASQFPKPVILAIDVPRRNEQSIQAMENFFDHLQGLHGTFNKWEIYYLNAFQRSLSVELVSIGGNIQYLVRCPGDWRNLVEAAVYSQYPDAEITEVEDYVNSVPKYYPNDTHDVWGCEFTLSANEYIPIKSYLKFEHRFSETFVDPMAALLETMSSIGPGENIWIQYILTPLAVDWGIKEGKAEVNKILGIVTKPKESMFDKFIKYPAAIFNEFTEQIAGFNLSGGDEAKAADQPSRMPFLSPGQKEVVEGIEKKVARWAFRTKIRFVYVFEKGKGNKVIGVNGIIGAFKQWNDINANGLKPALSATGTSAPQYILVDYRRNTRKNTIMRAYRGRDTVIGAGGKPLCSEELASLWHFPSMYVKSPMVKKTDFTKISAPVGLPMEPVGLKPVRKETVHGPQASPISKERKFTPTFDYDSDDFEMQFAKDKAAFNKTRPARSKRLAEIAKEDEQVYKRLEQESQVKADFLQSQQPQQQPQVQAPPPSSPQVNQPPAVGSKSFPGNLPFID